MNGLKSTLDYARNNLSKAIDINMDSPERPKNVYLFNHSIPNMHEEAFMINGNIFWFPNLKSLNGAIIKNPQSQYIFCNEVCDCVGIGGTIKDKNGQTYIFGAHVYESILMFQMQNIVDKILNYGLIPDKVIYSPRIDTLSWEGGLDTLKNNFPNTINILREKDNQAEMIIGIEGILLNDELYKL